MSISKIFIPNYVCVVQMKDTKHIRRDFHSVTLVMPQGVPWGSKNIFFKHGHVAYQIEVDDIAEQSVRKIFILGSNR